MQNTINILDDYLQSGNEIDFFSEDIFHTMLIMERRRVKRYGKRFMLMMLDIDFINEHNGTVKKLIRILDDSSRETDIKGWYKNNSTIGIIFTEIDDVNKNMIIERIQNKINNALQEEHAERIAIKCLFFPKDKNSDDTIIISDTLQLDTASTLKTNSKTVSIVLKRALDIIGSFLAVILFSPFFIIIAALIKCTSKGPVLFRQKRIGFGGKEFTLLKFRSMHANNDDSAHREFAKNHIHGNSSEKCGTESHVFKVKDDPRITRIGAFLRKSSFDELPQFFNVLMGHMSLVGPRPAIRYEVKEYDTWHKRRVLEAKPGITGVWQVKGRSRVAFDDMVRMDLQYIKKWSILLDLMLIIKTPAAMFKAEGAY